jgi:hypothetical protein
VNIRGMGPLRDVREDQLEKYSSYFSSNCGNFLMRSLEEGKTP